MNTNSEVLKIARKYLGQGGTVFRKFCGLPNGSAWCNAYVDYVAYKGDVSSLYFNGRKETYCPSSIKWCDKNLALVPPYLAMPMDIIYFDWEKNGVPNHIGLVVDKKSTSAIRTIEGNTSGGIVAEKTRAVGYVQGIYRPHYKPKSIKLGAIEEDGDFGYNSIANLQRALGIRVDGILGKDTVRALQKSAGATADGAWGKNTSKAVQKMTGTTVDGEFGKKSVISLQKWVNNINTHNTTETPSQPKLEAYKGTYPDLIKHGREKIVQVALELAYPRGTSKSKYTYGVGEPKPAYKKALKEAYPNRSTWSKQCRAGASCDVGAGTILRISGVDKTISRALANQIPHIQKSDIWKKTSLKNASSMEPGDVGIYSNYGPGAHIWIGIGNGKIVESNHTAKCFLHVDTDNYTSSNKKVWGIYRSQKPMALRKGDETKQVHMEKFEWF